jgi:oxygen-dependent protoporphyrinogen oxidase
VRGNGPFRVVVAGAGISGLTCAHRLARAARERSLSLDLALLEASPRAGGAIATEKHGGFLIEGGPDCFITDKPWGVDLCRELGLEREILGTNPECRRSFVVRRGRLVPIPEGYHLLAPARLLPFATSRILGPAGKLRVACDLLLPRGPEVADESLASFVRRRFGREALEALAQPLVAGIYNADPERLSLRATFPRFLEMERRDRSVILALLRARRSAAGRARGVSGARYSLFVTLRSGLTTLVDRLTAGLPDGALRTGTAVTAVRPGTIARYVVETAGGRRIPADAVVLALPAHAAAAAIRGLDPEIAAALSGVRYGTAATVSLAYRRSDVPAPLDGFGFVVPRRERRALTACSFSSVKFAGRAPEDGVLFRAFVGGALAEETGTEGLERAARDDLKDLLGVGAEPLLARTFVWRRAMAQYEVLHLDRVAAIEARLERHPGLALAGNGLRGVGLPDCVRSGELAAERAAAEMTCERTARDGGPRTTASLEVTRG